MYFFWRRHSQINRLHLSWRSIWWGSISWRGPTERHIQSRKAATLVTTRSSGSSYLNRVELQNGSLALGHYNAYIPSTLADSCIDPQRAICEDKLKCNLSIAIDAYISRVDGCCCGDTTIHLYKGAESCVSKVDREKLLVFLKGSKWEK